MNSLLKECYELLPVGSTSDDSVSLTFEERRKSRLRVKLGSYDLAWFLPRGKVVHDGEVLLCRDGYKVRVEAAPEEVSELRPEDPLQLPRFAYHLGNRHVSLQIGAGWLRYHADHVLDEMIKTLGGKAIRRDAPFDPEDGAYHTHEHEHEH